MAKLTAKEFMEKAKIILGERDDDEALSFLEDCKDTITDGKEDDWKTKYDEAVKEKEELDKSWRQKYRDTFFSSDSQIDKDKDTNPSKHADDKDDEVDLEEQAKKVRFDDLFEPADK